MAGASSYTRTGIVVGCGGRPRLANASPASRSRPHGIGPVIEAADAVFYAWYPGPAGGTAIAELILGGREPVGRLPVSLPSSSAVLPVAYNERLETTVRYVDAEAAATFPFGAGLGYTTWTLGPGTASTEPTTSVSAPLTNTGVRRGTQVVQLYARVHVAGLLPRRAILAGFTHVTLDPGETAEVRVAVEPDAYFGISPGATGTLELWPSITGAGDPAEPVVVHIGAT